MTAKRFYIFFDSLGFSGVVSPAEYCHITTRFCLLLVFGLSIIFSFRPADILAEDSEQELTAESQTTESKALPGSDEKIPNQVEPVWTRDKPKTEVPPSIPLNIPSSGLGSYMFTVFKGLLIVSLILVIVTRCYKALPQNKELSLDNISIISRKSLSPKVQLVVVEVGCARFLLTLGSDSAQLLTELKPGGDQREPGSQFSEQLAEAQKSLLTQVA